MTVDHAMSVTDSTSTANKPRPDEAAAYAMVVVLIRCQYHICCWWWLQCCSTPLLLLLHSLPVWDRTDGVLLTACLDSELANLPASFALMLLFALLSC
jgi:hypothetical protein